MHNEKIYKLAILTTHPIEFQVPLFRKIAQEKNIDLMVYFCWDFGVTESYDPGFGKSVLWDKSFLEGYPYEFLKNIHPWKTSGRFFGLINLGVVSALSKKKHDAVLIMGWQVFTMWLALVTSFLKGLPVFLRGESPLNQELLKSSLNKALKKIIFPFLFRFISTLFYISTENKKFYKYYSVPENKLVSLPYAVDNDRFFAKREQLAKKKSELRKKLGIDENAVVILFSGKLIDKKRPFDLLMAYELLQEKLKKSEFRPAILVFMGDGVLRERLEIYAKEKSLSVCFAGFVDQMEIENYYALADIYVQPSGLGDTAPMPVNEAMCFGLPIVASDVIGTSKDRVNEGKNGFIFECGNFNQLSMFLYDLVVDSEMRKNFSLESIKLIEKTSYNEDINGILFALEKIGLGKK